MLIWEAGKTTGTGIIFDPSLNVYRVVGEAVGNAFKDGLKLK